MTTTPRLETMRSMVAKNPENALARFGLANELMKVQQHADAAAEYESYLARYDDEGNGWGRLAEAYEHLGRTNDARAALTKGIAASRRFGHAGMANELEARLEELTDA
jgi:predicted Zn-dependent protease